jgi:16S rRNA (uracil1498-N3)-methyltransferase
MRGEAPKIRLHVAAALAPGAAVPLDPGQAHYLANVMRRAPGDAVLVFNGRDGEWRAVIRALGKKGGALEAAELTRPQRAEADLWLLAAPIKRTAIDFVAAKATELGVAAIQPVFTGHTAVQRVNLGRIQANCLEAAEQCHRLTVPEIRPAAALPGVIEHWPSQRRLLLCDETGAGAPIAAALEQERGRMPEPWAILIGPEGGFAQAELAALRRLPAVLAVSLGARLLRADTAALAALAVWQSVLGEWRG